MTAGTTIGKSGLERTYDRYLRGVDGKQRIQVDAFGRPVFNPRLKRVEPIAGQRVRLSLDSGCRGPRSSSSATSAAAGPAPRSRWTRATVAAGDGLAPHVRPRLLTKEITQERYDALWAQHRRPRPAVQPRDLRPVSDRLDDEAVTALASLERA